MTGLYFHIPFCIKKCSYCAFDSIGSDRWNEELKQLYVNSLIKELQLSARQSGQKPTADTVYFGGGTPSLLSPAQIASIISEAGKYFILPPDAEISMEANPATADRDAFLQFKKAGINRVSIGGQSFDDALLKKLGRIHTSEELSECIEAAYSAGFNSVSIDLIFGFPGHTKDLFKKDIETALSFPISHISLYMFFPEEGTPLGDACIHGRSKCPEDEELAEMMDCVHTALTEKGFLHYEISNFAKQGHICRHNMKYWRYGEYLGFGSSACSFRNGFRYKNTSDLFKYIKKLSKGISAVQTGENLSKRKKMSEYAMLALRCSEGINSERFKEYFKTDLTASFQEPIERLLSLGFLENDSGNFKIPYRHYPIQSEIAEYFFE